MRSQPLLHSTGRKGGQKNKGTEKCPAAGPAELAITVGARENSIDPTPQDNIECQRREAEPGNEPKNRNPKKMPASDRCTRRRMYVSRNQRNLESLAKTWEKEG